MIVKERLGVYAVIIDDKKIALVMKKNGGYKGKYDLPGGGNKHRESLIDTLYREVNEETNTNVTSYQLLNVYTYNIKWKMDDGNIEDLHHVGVIYKATIDNKDIKSDFIHDTLFAKWINLSEIQEDMVTPFTWYALKELKLK